MNLLPYIYDQALLSTIQRKPMMRPMVYSYPGEVECYEMFDQYMFGDDLLVAPIIEEGATERSMYFPKGRWTNLWTDEVTEGPTFKRVAAELMDIPVYVKEGAILLLNTDQTGKLGSWVGNKMTLEQPHLKIYPTHSTTKVITDHLKNETKVELASEKNKAIVQINSSYKDMKVTIYTNLLPEVDCWSINGVEYSSEKNRVLQAIV